MLSIYRLSHPITEFVICMQTQPDNKNTTIRIGAYFRITDHRITALKQCTRGKE